MFMDHVTIITGGAQGIGKATAHELTQKGHEVVIVDCDKTALTKASKEVGCTGMVCDVSSPAACKKVIDRVVKKYGKIDALINNAGIYKAGPVDKNVDKDVDMMMKVNVCGPMYLVKYAVPHMKKKKSGTIINIVSQAGCNAKADRTAYYASKWALTGMTKCLQKELHPFGIRVTGLYPYYVKTGLFKKAGVKRAMHDAIDPLVVAQTISFILSFDSSIVFPDISLAHIKN